MLIPKIRKNEAERSLFIPQIRKIEAEQTRLIPEIGKIEAKKTNWIEVKRTEAVFLKLLWSPGIDSVSVSRGVADSPYRQVGESATPRISESGSRYLIFNKLQNFISQ